MERTSFLIIWTGFASSVLNFVLHMNVGMFSLRLYKARVQFLFAHMLLAEVLLLGFALAFLLCA
jgi:hypothetical protein